MTLQKNRHVPVFFSRLLKTIVIDKLVLTLFETASMTQIRRFTNRCNRRPIAAVFKNAGIGSPITLE